MSVKRPVVVALLAAVFIAVISFGQPEPTSDEGLNQEEQGWERAYAIVQGYTTERYGDKGVRSAFILSNTFDPNIPHGQQNESVPLNDTDRHIGKLLRSMHVEHTAVLSVNPENSHSCSLHRFGLAYHVLQEHAIGADLLVIPCLNDLSAVVSALDHNPISTMNSTELRQTLRRFFDFGNVVILNTHEHTEPTFVDDIMNRAGFETSARGFAKFLSVEEEHSADVSTAPYKLYAASEHMLVIGTKSITNFDRSIISRQLHCSVAELPQSAKSLEHQHIREKEEEVSRLVHHIGSLCKKQSVSLPFMIIYGLILLGTAFVGNVLLSRWLVGLSRRNVLHYSIAVLNCTITVIFVLTLSYLHPENQFHYDSVVEENAQLRVELLAMGESLHELHAEMVNYRRHMEERVVYNLKLRRGSEEYADELLSIIHSRSDMVKCHGFHSLGEIDQRCRLIERAIPLSGLDILYDIRPSALSFAVTGPHSMKLQLTFMIPPKAEYILPDQWNRGGKEVVMYHIDRTLGLWIHPPSLVRPFTRSILLEKLTDTLEGFDIGHLLDMEAHVIEPISSLHGLDTIFANVQVHPKEWVPLRTYDFRGNSVSTPILLDILRGDLIANGDFRLDFHDKRFLRHVSNTIVFDFITGNRKRRMASLACEHETVCEYHEFQQIVLDGHDGPLSSASHGQEFDYSHVHLYDDMQGKSDIDPLKDSFASFLTQLCVFDKRVVDRMDGVNFERLFRNKFDEESIENETLRAMDTFSFIPSVDIRVSDVLTQVRRCISRHGENVVFSITKTDYGIGTHTPH